MAIFELCDINLLSPIIRSGNFSVVSCLLAVISAGYWLCCKNVNSNLMLTCLLYKTFFWLRLILKSLRCVFHCQLHQTRSVGRKLHTLPCNTLVASAESVKNGCASKFDTKFVSLQHIKEGVYQSNCAVCQGCWWGNINNTGVTACPAASVNMAPWAKHCHVLD